MMPVQTLGKMLILLGGLITLIGIVLTFSDKIPFLGKLPGDISIKKENFQVYIPITTSIVLSVVISLILWLLNLISKK